MNHQSETRQIDQHANKLAQLTFNHIQSQPHSNTHRRSTFISKKRQEKSKMTQSTSFRMLCWAHCTMCTRIGWKHTCHLIESRTVICRFLCYAYWVKRHFETNNSNKTQFSAIKNPFCCCNLLAKQFLHKIASRDYLTVHLNGAWFIQPFTNFGVAVPK